MNGDSEQPTMARMRTSKPIVGIDDITDLLHQRYGIQIAKLKEFESYDDRTYYVKAEPGCGTGERSEFIAKVLNSTSSAPKGVVDVITDLLDYLKAYPELGCQFALPNVNGDLLSYEMIPNDVRDGDVLLGREKGLSALRLFNFVPGKPMSASAPLPPNFFFDVGIHLGKLQKALQEYPGDVEPLKLKAQAYLWCLSNVPCLRSFLPLVQDDKKRRLAEEVISQFEATVVPVMDGLRKGIVESDFNNDNVLVTSSAEGTSDCSDNSPMTGGVAKYQISGVVDFDDTMYTCLVYEIAIAMMYAMFCCDEPIVAAAYVLTGFETVSPLPRNERRLLKVLVAGRFAQSVLMSLMQVKNHPDNVYVGQTLIEGWSLLGKWWSQSEVQLQELWDCVKARCAGQH
ncbi:hydroxylysine kinase-like [Patiria miniata]|uniref:Aminoglycoside phosphotransferase domain-containing protein n=1 Tax=Patiria miniata TaxID=46514 RepID=A0A913YZ74_PATMI|nr:hydroxylysine kinase-like [Patiria miniata]XP_038044703.1 hydroxylysine kinase-like [Patiria miniata]